MKKNLIAGFKLRIVASPSKYAISFNISFFFFIYK